MVETDTVEWPVEKVAYNEIVEALQKIKSGKATGTTEVSVEMIIAIGEIWVKVMMELCQYVLDGRGMPDEWKTSVFKCSNSFSTLDYLARKDMLLHFLINFFNKFSVLVV